MDKQKKSDKNHNLQIIVLITTPFNPEFAILVTNHK